MRAKLTQPFVDTAKAKTGAERTIYWHERMEGFGLMVTASGHKSFVYHTGLKASAVERRFREHSS